MLSVLTMFTSVRAEYCLLIPPAQKCEKKLALASSKNWIMIRKPGSGVRVEPRVDILHTLKTYLFQQIVVLHALVSPLVPLTSLSLL